MKRIHKLFAKLSLSFLLLSIVPLTLTGWATYSIAVSILEERIHSEMNAMFNQDIKAMKLFVDDLNRMGNVIANSSAASRFLNITEESDYLHSFLELDQQIENAHLIRPENVGITIVNETGYVYYNGYSYQRDSAPFSTFPWLNEEEITSKGYLFSSMHQRPYSNFDEGQAVFSYMRPLRSSNLSSTGMLIIDFRTDVLHNLLDNQQAFDLRKSQELIFVTITDRHGSLIYPTPSENMEMPAEVIDAYTHPFHQTADWTMTAYFSDQLFEPIDRIKQIVISVVLGSVFICLLASLIISRRISKPIQTMTRFMKRIETGDFNLQLRVRSHDEIGELSHGFNQMVIKIKQLLELVFIEQNKKRRAEITALQSQINPHFLYNTLESINSVARKNKQHEISKMLVMLGRLFRISISNFDEFVPIQKELDAAALYLDIQRFRSKKLKAYRIIVPAEITESYTIKWILQPLIENAVIHGIEPKPEGGEIAISGWIEGNDVLIRIEDNGMGVSPASLNQLQSSLEQREASVPKDTSHIGLSNVNARIKLHFGQAYGLSLDSIPSQGMTVTLKLPRRTKHDNMESLDRG